MATPSEVKKIAAAFQISESSALLRLKRAIEGIEPLKARAGRGEPPTLDDVEVKLYGLLSLSRVQLQKLKRKLNMSTDSQ
ncbi:MULTISPECIES: hypothetical protein [Acidithiobacillus]|uniref:Uncharacterized protein n=2 Tax=Acidithiobacillus TaxID=119977 RepID=A0A179BNW5_ACIFR|nr:MULTISPECIES: hypothetical protein [Acidithiobacillus]MEB8487274.1 hypothetical protein [Acidithiobacillus ferriphilus]MEB8491260.1 hypothetical protein [Acidithiobacillus ferriphilus]MEB8493074.1 hypothetical protein [Acidithiobacillus ferriphilus]MEB8513087.1 hypothetical protein [Acidithiobacillus ferriphilus]MEB8520721.1 hypothetical protein [Acidithiobacillus ferriphilus]